MPHRRAARLPLLAVLIASASIARADGPRPVKAPVAAPLKAGPCRECPGPQPRAPSPWLAAPVQVDHARTAPGQAQTYQVSSGWTVRLDGGSDLSFRREGGVQVLELWEGRLVACSGLSPERASLRMPGVSAMLAPGSYRAEVDGSTASVAVRAGSAQVGSGSGTRTAGVGWIAVAGASGLRTETDRATWDTLDREASAACDQARHPVQTVGFAGLPDPKVPCALTPSGAVVQPAGQAASVSRLLQDLHLGRAAPARAATVAAPAAGGFRPVPRAPARVMDTSVAERTAAARIAPRTAGTVTSVSRVTAPAAPVVRPAPAPASPAVRPAPAPAASASASAAAAPTPAVQPLPPASTSGVEVGAARR